MLSPNQLFEVKITEKNIKFYTNLGYNVTKKDIITVPPEHLTKGSRAVVQVLCDFCGKPIKNPYYQYIKRHIHNKDCCKECQPQKARLTFIEKYGVTSPLKNENIKNKMKQTNLLKYGVEFVGVLPSVREKREETCIQKWGVKNPGMVPEIQNKIKEVFIEKYGCDNPFANEEIKELIKETNLEKYGTEYASQAELVKEHIKQTNLERYGYEYTLQVPEIREKIKTTNLQKYGSERALDNPEIAAKARATMYQNGKVPVSSQQITLYKMIKAKYPTAEINYPFSTCSLDVYVCINDIQIDVEYDCWYWHQDKQKDIKRDKFLQSQGLKTLRIRSGHLLPTEEELFDAIGYLINTEHHFKEIILSDWKEGEICQEQLPAV